MTYITRGKAVFVLVREMVRRLTYDGQYSKCMSWLSTLVASSHNTKARTTYALFTRWCIVIVVAMNVAVLTSCTAEPHSEAEHAAAEISETQHAPPYRGLLVSNHPLYLLAQAATAGVESPKKIMSGGDVGHHYHMTPSARKLIAEANAIFWVGPQLEAPLSKVLSKHPHAAALVNQASLTFLPLRDTRGKKRSLINRQTMQMDPHIWLDPVQAKHIVELIARQRSRHFPEYKQAYFQNYQRFAADMDERVGALRLYDSQRASHHYIAYHDAYQYLEDVLNLSFIGSLTSSPELPMTPKQLHWLATRRQALQKPTAVSLSKPKESDIKNSIQPVCVLSEAPLKNRLQQLQPTHLFVIDESMQQSQSFLSAWTMLAQGVMHCVASQ